MSIIKTLLCLSACLWVIACSQIKGDKVDPAAEKNSASLTEEGYAALASNHPREAVSIFDQALSINTKNTRAYQGKGIALDQQGKHEDAESAYKAGLAIDPGAIGIINNLGLSYILRGQYDNAIQLLTPHSVKEPVHAKVIENLAIAYCLKGDEAQAKKLYKNRLKEKELKDNLAFCRKFEQIRKS